MAEDFFSQFNKSYQPNNDIVPLAMQAMKLKMEQEHFEMAKDKILQENEKNNELRERVAQLPIIANSDALKAYIPQGQDKPVLDDASGSSDPKTLKQVATGQAPADLAKMLRQPTAHDFVNVQMQIDPEKGIKNAMDLYKTDEKTDSSMKELELRLDTQLKLRDMIGAQQTQNIMDRFKNAEGLAQFKKELGGGGAGTNKDENTAEKRIQWFIKKYETGLATLHKQLQTKGLDINAPEAAAIKTSIEAYETEKAKAEDTLGKLYNGLDPKQIRWGGVAAKPQASTPAPDKVSSLKKDLMNNGYTSKSADEYIAKAKAAGKL